MSTESIQLNKKSKYFLLSLLLIFALYLSPVAGHARYTQCGGRFSDMPLTVGSRIPRRMGGGTIKNSERSLLVHDEDGVEEILPNAVLKRRSVIEVELALLRGEQHVCEVEGAGAEFEREEGCTRVANENPMFIEVFKPGELTIRCAYSSGPGRGIFTTSDLKFRVR